LFDNIGKSSVSSELISDTALVNNMLIIV